MTRLVLRFVALCAFAVPLTSCSGRDAGRGGKVCGDAIAGGVERCDRTDLEGETCTSLGFGPGTLGCALDCASFDITGCTASPTCGNGQLDGAEVCDGAALDGASCTSLGLGTGMLGCRLDCLAFDVSGCSGPATCGNGTVEGPEVCDGSELAGATCASAGAGVGALSCASSCLAFDTSGCVCAPSCGTAACGPDPACGASCGTCEGAATCESGTCVEDCDLPRILADRTLDLDVGVYTRAGKVTLNGAPMPDDTILDGNSRGHLRFVNVDTKDEVIADFSELGMVYFAVTLFRGTYDVYVHGNYAVHQSVLPANRDGLVMRGFQVETNGTLDLDIRTAQLDGWVTLNGAPMPNDTILDGVARGRLRFRDQATLSDYDYDLGQTGQATYSMRVFAGSYDVFVHGYYASQQNVLPSNRDMLVVRGLAVETSTVRFFDAKTVSLSGQVTLNGATMPNDSISDAVARGDLRFRNLDTEDFYEYPLGETGTATYAGVLFAGRYEVTMRSAYASQQSVLPSRRSVRLYEELVLSASGTRDFDARTATVTGAVTLNGATMPNDAIVDAVARGRIRLRNLETLEDYDVDFGETGPASYTQRVFVGLYDVYVHGYYASQQSVLPSNADMLVRRDVPITASATMDIDAVVVSVSGFVTANGAALPNDTILDGNPRGVLQYVNVDTEDVYASSLGETILTNYLVRMFAGTYDVYVETGYAVQQSALPGKRRSLIERRVVITETTARTVDLRVARVTGAVTLNGMPMRDDGRLDAIPRGMLRFRNADTLEVTEVSLGETGPVTYTVDLLGGAYDVYVHGSYTAQQNVLPGNRDGWLRTGCRAF